MSCQGYPGNEPLSVGTAQRAGRKRHKPPPSESSLWSSSSSDSHRFPRPLPACKDLVIASASVSIEENADNPNPL